MQYFSTEIRTRKAKKRIDNERRNCFLDKMRFLLKSNINLYIKESKTEDGNKQPKDFKIFIAKILAVASICTGTRAIINFVSHNHDISLKTKTVNDNENKKWFYRKLVAT